MNLNLQNDEKMLCSVFSQFSPREREDIKPPDYHKIYTSY